jgi:hypothetical protein
MQAIAHVATDISTSCTKEHSMTLQRFKFGLIGLVVLTSSFAPVAGSVVHASPQVVTTCGPASVTPGTDPITGTAPGGLVPVGTLDPVCQSDSQVPGRVVPVFR